MNAITHQNKLDPAGGICGMNRAEKRRPGMSSITAREN
jgi:hypothetical protein